MCQNYNWTDHCLSKDLKSSFKSDVIIHATQHYKQECEQIQTSTHKAWCFWTTTCVKLDNLRKPGAFNGNNLHRDLQWRFGITNHHRINIMEIWIRPVLNKLLTMVVCLLKNHSHSVINGDVRCLKLKERAYKADHLIKKRKKRFICL